MWNEDLSQLWDRAEAIKAHPRTRTIGNYSIKRVETRNQFRNLCNLPAAYRPKSWQAFNNVYLTLFPYRNGIVLSEQKFVENVLENLAQEMSQLWSSIPAEELTTFSPARLESTPKETFSPDPIQVYPIFAVELTRRFETWCRRQQPDLNCQSNMVLIHGDLKVDNIVVDKDDNIYLVDFENAGKGFPEDDLASFLASRFVFGLSLNLVERCQRKGQNLRPDELQTLVHEVDDLICSESAQLLTILEGYGFALDLDYLAYKYLQSFVVRTQSLSFYPGSTTLMQLCSSICDSLLSLSIAQIREGLSDSE